MRYSSCSFMRYENTSPLHLQSFLLGMLVSNYAWLSRTQPSHKMRLRSTFDRCAVIVFVYILFPKHQVHSVRVYNVKLTVCLIHHPARKAYGERRYCSMHLNLSRFTPRPLYFCEPSPRYPSSKETQCVHEPSWSNVCFSCRESNPHSSAVQPVVSSL